MTWIRIAVRRVLALFSRRRFDADLDDEVRAHLDLLASEYQRRGMPPAAARLAARRAFGGVEAMKETYGDRRGLAWVDDARRDIHQALRALRRAPLFAGAAIMTLAVGMSAVAGIFAILNAFMFRPMPVYQPEQLVSIGTAPDSHVQLPHGVSFRDLQDYRQQSTVFTDLMGYSAAVGALDTGDIVERITMYAVTDNYFSVLGVAPSLGRLIRTNEGTSRGDAPVLVLTHEYWLARFGGDPSVVGRVVRLNGRPFTIVGVTPEPFDRAHSLLRPSAYVPLWMYDDLMNLAPDDNSTFENRGRHQLWVLGRTKPAVSLSEARAALRVTATALARQYPATNRDVELVVIPETHARPNPNIGPFFRVAAMAFAALAVLVLFITSANVANLLMARAIAREREVALRAALGAGRGRLVRQLLTESVVLALVAGAVALPVVVLALRGVAQGTTASTALVSLRPDFSLDARVLGVAFVLALLAGVVSGLGPALFAARGELNAVLKSGGRSASGEPRAWLRSSLVVLQVALSLMLLVSGGLFLRSLDRARQVEIGLDSMNLVLASARPSELGYNPAERLTYFTNTRNRIRAIAGVEQAAWTEWVPISTVTNQALIWLESRPPRPEEPAATAASARVDADYFATAHIPLVEGRTFNDGDDASSPPVAIVNETLASQFWPQQSPIGRSLVVAGTRVEIIGVVPNGKYLFVWEEPRAMVFRHLVQSVPDSATLVVRSSRGPTGLMSEVQRTLGAVDPSVFVFDVRTMEQHLDREAGGFLAFGMGAMVTSMFGAAGVLLAAIGLYGMIAGRVSQRTHEIGVRIALGARRGDILRDVLGRGVWLASIGIAGGAILAALVAQGLRTLLLGVSPFDPLTHGVVAMFLVAVSLLASFVPARRATRVDPVVALRAE